VQLESIDTRTVNLAQNRSRAESPRAHRTPAEEARNQAIYKTTKESFEKTSNTSSLKNKELERMLEQFNELAKAFNIQLRFSVNKNVPNHISVKVINVETNEVIREVPPQKFSTIGSELLNAVGFIVDKTA